MTFEDKVRSFLKKHKPGLAYMARRIANDFANDQSAVMEHLHARYVKGAPSTYDPKKTIAQGSGGLDLNKGGVSGGGLDLEKSNDDPGLADEHSSTEVGLGNVNDEVSAPESVDLGKGGGDDELATDEDFEVEEEEKEQ